MRSEGPRGFRGPHPEAEVSDSRSPRLDPCLETTIVMLLRVTNVHGLKALVHRVLDAGDLT